MRRARRISGCGLVTLSAVFLASAAGGAQAAPSVAFLSHQAVYDLSLKTSRGNASVSNARGRILYNFAGSAARATPPTSGRCHSSIPARTRPR